MYYVKLHVLALAFLLGSVLLIVSSGTTTQISPHDIYADVMGPLPPSSDDGEELPDGEDATEAPQITSNPDGSTSTVYPDGSEVTEYPDGTITICAVSYDAQESESLALIRTVSRTLNYPTLYNAQYYSIEFSTMNDAHFRQMAEDDALEKNCETFGKQDGTTTDPSAEDVSPSGTQPDDGKTVHESLGGGSFKDTTYNDDGTIKEVRVVRPGGVEDITSYGENGKPKITRGYDRVGNVISSTTFDPNGKPTAKTNYNSEGIPTGTSTNTYYPDGTPRATLDYDANGNLKTKTAYITGDDGSQSRAVSIYQPDGKPMYTTTYGPDGKTLKNIDYGPDGKPKSIVIYNPDGTEASTTTYGPDGKPVVTTPSPSAPSPDSK